MSSETKPKRGRGRPKGSKNKPKSKVSQADGLVELLQSVQAKESHVSKVLGQVRALLASV